MDKIFLLERYYNTFTESEKLEVEEYIYKNTPYSSFEHFRQELEREQALVKIKDFIVKMGFERQQKEDENAKVYYNGLEL